MKIHMGAWKRNSTGAAKQETVRSVRFYGSE
jgi:hypothetical protein